MICTHFFLHLFEFVSILLPKMQKNKEISSKIGNCVKNGQIDQFRQKTRIFVFKNCKISQKTRSKKRIFFPKKLISEATYQPVKPKIHPNTMPKQLLNSFCTNFEKSRKPIFLAQNEPLRKSNFE